MKFTPAASIFTTACPGSGLGSGTSSRRSASGPPPGAARGGPPNSFHSGKLKGRVHGNGGVLGLGSMGLPIARHVLQAGHTVVVYNRTRSRADALQPLRPTVAASPAAAR